jgi:hypothetical protein
MGRVSLPDLDGIQGPIILRAGGTCRRAVSDQVAWLGVAGAAAAGAAETPSPEEDLVSVLDSAFGSIFDSGLVLSDDELPPLGA